MTESATAARSAPAGEPKRVRIVEVGPRDGLQLEPSFAWPKPRQKPWPPIHVGGGWPGGAKRAIAWGDGWIPVGMPDVAAAKLPALRRMAEEAGRDPAALEVSIYAAPTEPDALARLRDAGIAPFRSVAHGPTPPPVRERGRGG